MFASMPFEIIDCHVHPSTGPENHYGWFMPFESPETLVNELRRCGIRRACGALIPLQPGTDFSSTAQCNEWAAEYHRRFPDFYLPGIEVHPAYPEESCREIEKYHRMPSMRWIGELVGYVMGYGDSYGGPGACAIYDLAQQLGLPVNLHSANLAQLAQLCEAFPRLSFVLAHPGAGRDEYKTRIALVAQYPNLHLDLSGTGIQRWGMLRYGIDTDGPEKLLFGTDFPIGTPASYIACVLNEPLTDNERELIFAGNFKRLTGLS